MIVRRLINLPEARPWYTMAEPDWLKRETNSRYGGLAEPPSGPAAAGVFPLINLTENKDIYILRAELPGMKSENLDISIDGNNLTISGERKVAFKGENARYHRRERESGKFSRVIGLDKPIESERIEAKLVSGILTVKLPVMEKAKPRQIKVTN